MPDPTLILIIIFAVAIFNLASNHRRCAPQLIQVELLPSTPQGNGCGMLLVAAVVIIFLYALGGT